MTTSVSNILAQAYARSSGNRSSSLIEDAAEGVWIANRVQRLCISAGARINPDYFGSLYTMPAVGNYYLRPLLTEMVYRIEMPTGDEVVVVPVEDRYVATGSPRVYQLGALYYSVGEDGDPDGETLSAYVVSLPVDMVDINSTMTTVIPDAFVPLLVDEIAIHLALKDRRMDELNDLRRSRDSWLRLWINFLEHETAARVRRFVPVTSGLNTIQMIGAMFEQGGGTDA